jgi:hypothetical protein
MKIFLLTIIFFPLLLSAKEVFFLDGYYHNDLSPALSTKIKVEADIALVNRILHLHQINGYEFKLRIWKPLTVPRRPFYLKSLDGEAHEAYRALYPLIDKAHSNVITFYVREYDDLTDGVVKGIAVQGGSFFTYLQEGGEAVYFTFAHELFHAIGLGDSKVSYGNPYYCGNKHTLMHEVSLPSVSKTYLLSDPSISKNGINCGHENQFDNARYLKELLFKRRNENLDMLQ